MSSDDPSSDDLASGDKSSSDDLASGDDPSSDDLASGDKSSSDDLASGEPGYAECMAELGTILSELEGDDPDVDVLASRVERAATLIEICRRRITNASIQVERVVAALQSGTDA